MDNWKLVKNYLDLRMDEVLPEIEEPDPIWAPKKHGRVGGSGNSKGSKMRSPRYRKTPHGTAALKHKKKR